MRKFFFGPWPRWAKAARNLLFAALTAYLVWATLGAPLPETAHLRRYERRALTPRGEIVLRYQGDSVAEQTTLSVSDHAAAGSWAWVDWLVPLEGSGPQLAPLRCIDPVWGLTGPGSVDFAHSYALVRPPEGAVSAELTLTNGQGTFTARGAPEDAVLLFQIPYPEGNAAWLEQNWNDANYFTWTVTVATETGTYTYSGGKMP